MLLDNQILEQLVSILETEPEWRQRFKNALFDLDIESSISRLEKAFEQLAEIQQQHSINLIRIEKSLEKLIEIVQQHAADIAELKSDMKIVKSDVAVLKTDVAVLKTDVAVLKTDVAVLKGDVGVLKGDVATLKGSSYERNYRDKASGIFGRFIRRGRNRIDDIADQLYEALDTGIVSKADITQVLAADLLWGGRLRHGPEEVFIVLEASWRAEVNDVERSRLRADILHKIGLIAVPIVAGMVWDDEALALAHSQTVVVGTGSLIDDDCWQNALSTTLSKFNDLQLVRL